jgi:hypothetical protein
MPFTLAHPAAVLPLRGLRYLRTVPLVLGAVTPDLPYYVPVRFGHLAPETHTVRGSLTTCVLLGYALLLGVLVLRRPLTALLSTRARWLCLAALAPFRQRPLEWPLALLSLLLGVWSHLLWDSFTHTDGWAVQRVAALTAPVSIATYHGTVCHVLQYLSSALGLLVLAAWYRRLPAPPAAPPVPGAPRSPVGPALALVAAAALLIGGVQATASYVHAPAFYHTLVVFLTRTLAWFALLYLVAGAVVTLEQRSAGPDGGEPRR